MGLYAAIQDPADRRQFVGGAEPLNRHWFERLFVVFDFRCFPEPDPGPSPVFVDELDAGRLQSQAYLGPCLVAAAQGAVLSLQPRYFRNRHIRCSCQFPL